MSLDTTISDREAISVARADCRRVDPEVMKRIHARAEKVREEIRRKHGTLNVAVDLVREVRDT